MAAATNGASLENCHTNVFALTELHGLQWKCFSARGDDHIRESDLLSDGQVRDPVLLSYGRCLTANLLAAWKRVSRSGVGPKLVHKKLWIFWYGEEPDLTQIVSPELKAEDETGSWNNGLPYECRLLLFRALHTLIERCLLTHRFVRLGKWFVQPHEASSVEERPLRYSYAFEFFLHGDVTVCLTVDVKLHPQITRLSKAHLGAAHKAELGGKTNVIMCPFGLAGTFSGKFLSPDKSKHLFQQWKHFFPVDIPERTDNQNSPGESSMHNPATPHDSSDSRFAPSPNPATPNPQSGPETRSTEPPFFVEVMVADVRMLYPSTFVLLVDDDLNTSPPNKDGPSKNSSSTPLVPDIISGLGNAMTKVRRRQFNATIVRSSEPSSKREGIGGVPSPKRERERFLINSTLNALFQDLSVHRKKERSARTQSLVDLTGNRPEEQMSVPLSVPNVVDSAEKRPCDCEASRPVIDTSPAPRSTSPPVTYPGQGQGLFAVKKAALEQHKQDNLLYEPPKNQPIFSFHRRVSSSSNQANQTQLAKQSGSSGKGGRGGDGLRPPQTPAGRNYNGLRGGVTSPGFCNTPLSQLGSVLPDTSPVSSPGSMSQSVQSPATPVTPFVAKTPRSVGPRSVAVAERELIPPSPVHPPSIEQPRSVQPVGGTPSLLESQNRSVLPDTVSPSRGTKRPHLGAIFDGEDDLDGIGFTFGPEHLLDVDDWAMMEPSASKMQKVCHPCCDTENISPDELSAPQTPVAPPVIKIPPKTNASVEPNPIQPDDTPVDKSSLNFASFCGTIGPLELSRMFPTPPSMESQPIYSPVDMHQRELEEPPVIVEPFTPAASGVMTSVHPSKYSPIESALTLRSLPEKLLYRPMWTLEPKFQHTKKTSQRSRHTSGPPRFPSPNNIPQTQMLNHRSPRSMDSYRPGPPFAYQMGNQMTQSLRPPPMYPPMGMRPRPNMLDPGMQYGGGNGMPNFEMMPSPAAVAVQPPPPPMPGVVECPALLLNVLLSDSLLNFFADKNFDGCIICACNQSIKSRDITRFHSPTTQTTSDGYNCTCGFSAVVNKQNGLRTGLFFEDELEITELPNLYPVENLLPNLGKLLDLNLTHEQEVNMGRLPEPVISLLRQSASNPFVSASTLLRNYPVYKSVVRNITQNQRNANAPKNGMDLQFYDMNVICCGVLELCKLVPVDPTMAPRLLDLLPVPGPGQIPSRPILHHWLHLGSTLRTSVEMVRVQRLIQPMLQEAVQLRRLTRLWDKTFTVEGPLTWKDFLRFADTNGTMDDQKVPLAIPSLLVGYEKEWLRISPTAFAHWEKMAYEPYGVKRDVVFAVLSPDNDYVFQAARAFFRDLTKSYELCGLGRHTAMPKLPEGILKVTQKRAQSVPLESLDDWFRCIGTSAMAEQLRLYAQLCNFLGPVICTNHREGAINQLFAPPAPAPLRVLPDSSSGGQGGDIVGTGPVGHNSSQNNAAGGGNGAIPNGGLVPSILTTTLPNYPFEPGYAEKDDVLPLIVIYLIDPFALSLEPNWEGVQRLASLGLLRSFQEMLKAIPPHMNHIKDSMVLQIVPMETILDHSVIEPVEVRSNVLRSLAVSVYAQNHRKVPPRVAPKMLTGFGPGMAFERWLKELKEKKIPMEMTTAYTPPYMLSSGREKKMDVMEMESKSKATTLLVAYCLSEDQKWILASCTDARGEMLETQVISVYLPNRVRRKGISIIKYGIRKLWDFVVGVINKLIGPCRLVIGRVGRLGHGELRVWSCVLNKKALVRASQQLRHLCNQCNSRLTGNMEMPNILSACLISLLPESSFRVAVDAFTHDERVPSFAARSPLSTPEDITCTHIYVFPTSATAQAQGPPGMAGEEHMEIVDDDFLGKALDPDTIGHDQGDNVVEGLDFTDIFNSFPDNNLNSPPGSPKPGDMRSLSPSSVLKHSTSQIGTKSNDPLDEPGQLLQQPLAVGYLVSTARVGPMPRWFFTATDQDENSCPIVLKAALHIHSAHVLHGEDIYSHNSRNSHPLDSGLTADVLKHILENYNALSWLIMDPASSDRRSCLPHHIQVLMQLYFAAAATL